MGRDERVVVVQCRCCNTSSNSPRKASPSSSRSNQLAGAAVIPRRVSEGGTAGQFSSPKVHKSVSVKMLRFVGWSSSHDSSQKAGTSCFICTSLHHHRPLSCILWGSPPTKQTRRL